MTELLQKAEEYVSEFYSQKINKDLLFHSIKHVKRTVKNVQILSQESGLSSDEIEVLMLAAWFHDAGHSSTYDRHERKSAEIARDFLREQNYPEDKIEKVMHCIWATDLDYKPKNLLEKVIRDADILHLGKKSFFKRNKELREEWETILGKKYSDEEWLKSDINFFTGHEFQTDYARQHFGEQKEQNLAL